MQVATESAADRKGLGNAIDMEQAAIALAACEASDAGAVDDEVPVDADEGVRRERFRPPGERAEDDLGGPGGKENLRVVAERADGANFLDGDEASATLECHVKFLSGALGAALPVEAEQTSDGLAEAVGFQRFDEVVEDAEFVSLHGPLARARGKDDLDIGRAGLHPCEAFSVDARWVDEEQSGGGIR